MHDGVESINKSTDNHFTIWYISSLDGWRECDNLLLMLHLKKKYLQWDSYYCKCWKQHAVRPSKPLNGPITIWLIFLKRWSQRGKGDWKGKVRLGSEWNKWFLHLSAIKQVWQSGFMSAFKARVPKFLKFLVRCLKPAEYLTWRGETGKNV